MRLLTFYMIDYRFLVLNQVFFILLLCIVKKKKEDDYLIQPQKQV